MTNPRSGKRILFVGTGGQGVITAAKLLGNFFVERKHQVISAQLHGMAQRGGAVQSTVMIDCGMSPALQLGRADIVLGCEPVETTRALPYMSPDTIVFMNVTPIIPYVLSQQFVLGKGSGLNPDEEILRESIRAVTQKLFTLDATKLADDAGSEKSVNVVMLGCLFGADILPYSSEEFLDSIIENVPQKIADINRRAFLSGVDIGKKTNLVEEDQWR